MDQHCVHHPDRIAATMCLHCRQSLCKSCVFVTPVGSFCSSECRGLHQAARERLKANKGIAAKFLVLIVLVIVAAILGMHLFRDKLPERFRGLDFLGRWFYR